MLRKIKKSILQFRNCASGLRLFDYAQQTSLPNSQAPQLIQLEERVFYSASPMEFPDGAEIEFDSDPDEPTELKLAWLQSDDTNSSYLIESQSRSSDELSVATELIIVDLNVDDYQHLIDGVVSNLDRDFEVVYLRQELDGIEQITELLNRYFDLDAIHIVSHGTQGQVQLGTSQLTFDSLTGYAGEIASWGDALRNNGDLLFYGCDLASTVEGELLVDSLSELTGADVAASDDLTGHKSLGGDWLLEYAAGSIDTASPFSLSIQQNWITVLTVTANDDSYSTGENTVLNEPADGVLDNDTGGALTPAIVGGATLNYDASMDTNGNSIWEDTTGVTNFDWTLDGTVTRNTSLAGAPPGITAAYVFDGTNGGVISETLQSLPGDPTDGSATFEIWFRPTDASVKTGVLFDTGSSNNGTNLRIYESGGNTFIEYLVLQDPGAFPPVETLITHDITTEMASGDFIQIAATIDVVTGTAVLYVNGVPVATDSDASLTDWSDGTEGSGLANAETSMAFVNSPNLDPFDGEIAIFRFYESALNSTALQQNYNAITQTGAGGLTVTAFDSVSVAGATVNVNADGSFSYDPGTLFDYLKDGETFIDTFTYTAEDTISNTDVATVSITVNGLTEAPTAITPTVMNVNENIDTSGGHSVGILSATDEDDSDTFNYSIFGGTDAGVFTIGGASLDELVLTDGTLNHEIKDTYTVIVRVTDGGSNTYNETITVNVTDINEVPTAISPKTVNINENTDTSSGLTVATLSTTDQDDSDTFNYSIFGGTDAGVFTIGGASLDELVLTDGTLNHEIKDTYTVIVRVTDGGSNTYNETITVNVTDINEVPTAITPATVNVAENTDTSSGLTVATLSTTDQDDSDTFNYSIFGGPDAGVFTIGGASLDELVLTDGTLDHEIKDTYTVIVRVTDGGSNTYNETITVNVTDINEVPTAITPATVNVAENTDTSSGLTVATLSTTDQDDSDTFNYSIFGGTDAGVFTIGGASLDELVLTDGTLDHEVKDTYTVIVRVTDGGSNTYNETITVNVTDINEVPTAISPKTVNINENTDTSGGLTVATLSTTDQDDSETFNYSIFGGPDAGVFTIGGASLDELVLTDGTLDHEIKDTYTVIVRVTDGGSNTYNETITVNVTDINEVPTAISPKTVNINENTDTSGGLTVATLSTTDQDDSETFNYSIFGGPDAGVFTIGGASLDELVLTDGTLDHEIKDTYTVIVRVTDGGSNTYNETITVNVTDINEVPTAISPKTVNINENTDTSSGLTVATLSTTDQDDSETFNYSIFGGPDAGVFTIGGASLDELVLTDGTLDHEIKDTYTVIVRVTDGGSNTYNETITVNVTDINEVPTAITPATVNVAENTDTSSGLTVATLSTTDQDDSDTFNYSIFGGTDAGVFTIGGASLDELVLTDGTLDHEVKDTYTVIVRVTDGGSNTYNETITVNVTDINEVPTAISPKTVNINENTDTSGGLTVATLSTTDQDDSETFNYSIFGGPDAGVFTIGGASLDELVLTDGTLNHEIKDTYTVIVRVTDGGSNTYNETITVNVTDINEVPTAITPATVNVAENTDTSSGLTVATLSTTDQDDSDTFNYSIFGGPDAGVFTIGGASLDELVLTDGTLDHEVKDTYTVIVRVTDGGSNTYNETITVNVTDINEVPTAITPATVNVNENTDTSGGLTVATLSTTDQDDSETFNYSIFGGTDAGVFTIGGASLDELVLTDGTLNHEIKDTYTVIVRVTDGGSNTYNETITVNVTDINEVPTAISPATVNVAENTDTSSGLTVATLSTTDQDDSDTFNYSIFGGPDAGVFTIGGASLDELVLTDGTLNHEIKDTYTVIVRVTDGGSNTYNETITVNVTDINEVPTGRDNSYTVNEDGSITGNVLTDDTGQGVDFDVDGDMLSVNSVAISGPSHGSLVLASDGSFTYSPDANYAGIDQFVYEVVDPSGAVNTAQVDITVTPQNDAPNASDDSFLAVMDSVLTITPGALLANDFDIDSNTISINFVGIPTNGQLIQLPDGTFTYTPNAGFAGIDSFQYTVTDGTISSSPASVLIETIPGFELPGSLPDETEPSEVPEKPATPEIEVPIFSPNSPDNQTPTNTIEPTSPAGETIKVANQIHDDGEQLQSIQLFPSSTDSYSLARNHTDVLLVDLLENSMSATRNNMMSFVDWEFDLSLLSELDSMRKDKQPIIDAEVGTMLSVAGISTALTVGYVFWMVRSGVLLAGLASSIPAWQILDPTAIIQFGNDTDKDEDNEDDDIEVWVDGAQSPPADLPTENHKSKDG